MLAHIPIPQDWRESYKGKVYGPSIVLRLSYVFILVVALCSFGFGIFYYGTRKVQEFEISSIDMTGTDGWECSSIASKTIDADLLSGISGYVRENEGIAQVLPESMQAKKIKRDIDDEDYPENYDPDSGRLKRAMASVDYRPTIQEKSGNYTWYKEPSYCVYMSQLCGLTYQNELAANFNIFPLSTGYFLDVGSPLDSAAFGEWTPEALSTMTIDSLQAPAVEECVDELVEATCTLDDDFVVDTGDAGNLKIYRFTLPAMKPFEECNQSYYENFDADQRESVGLFHYVWGEFVPTNDEKLVVDGCSSNYFDVMDHHISIIGNETFIGLREQYEHDYTWGAPTLSLIQSVANFSWIYDDDGSIDPYYRLELLDMSDQIDGWYALVEHRGPENSVCDNLNYVDGGTGYYGVMARSSMANGSEWVTFAGNEFQCEEVDIDWCIVDATNQMVAKQGDISLGTTISKKDPFQTRLYLALSDAQGETCSDRWENVCKSHHNFESICEAANIPPYKCERKVSLGILSTLSLSWSAVQLVLTTMIFSFGIAFGRFCKLQNENGAEDDEKENIETKIAGTSEGNKESKDVEMVNL